MVREGSGRGSAMPRTDSQPLNEQRKHTAALAGSTLGVAMACLVSVGIATPWGAPSLASPLSVLIVFPLFWLAGVMASEVSFVFFVAFVTASYFLWCKSALEPPASLPFRTVVLFCVLTAGSSVWFAAGWRRGMEWEGPAYTWGCLILNVLFVGIVLALGLTARRKPGFVTVLLTHWFLFVWAITYAFPYLGETP